MLTLWRRNRDILAETERRNRSVTNHHPVILIDRTWPFYQLIWGVYALGCRLDRSHWVSLVNHVHVTHVWKEGGSRKVPNFTRLHHVFSLNIDWFWTLQPVGNILDAGIREPTSPEHWKQKPAQGRGWLIQNATPGRNPNMQWSTYTQRYTQAKMCYISYMFEHIRETHSWLECKLVWLMCVAHISGRYGSPAGSSRGWGVIKDTPSVSVQLVGGVLTFDMQRSLRVHPACLHSNAFCVCLLSLLMLRWLTFLLAENFLMEGKKIPGLVLA